MQCNLNSISILKFSMMNSVFKKTDFAVLFSFQNVTHPKFEKTKPFSTFPDCCIDMPMMLPWNSNWHLNGICHFLMHMPMQNEMPFWKRKVLKMCFLGTLNETREVVQTHPSKCRKSMCGWETEKLCKMSQKVLLQTVVMWVKKSNTCKICSKQVVANQWSMWTEQKAEREFGFHFLPNEQLTFAFHRQRIQWWARSKVRIGMGSVTLSRRGMCGCEKTKTKRFMAHYGCFVFRWVSHSNSQPWFFFSFSRSDPFCSME